MGTRSRLLILAILLAGLAVALFARGPIPQSLSYHNFADQRRFFGVPHFLDVGSNLLFLIAGVWGLTLVASRSSGARFLQDGERWPYAMFCLGLVLTFLGSSYYHLHPSNARLVWDRLPMTLGFMGILSAAVVERVHVRAGLAMLPALIGIGLFSVLYWSWTEAQDRGDLRFYLLVQFGSLLALSIVLALFPGRYTLGKWLMLAIVLYGVAKVLEEWDARIYSFGHIVSGHTLKHLAAGLGSCLVVLMVRNRRPVPQPYRN